MATYASTASAKCVKKNYDRVMLNIKKGAKDELKKIAGDNLTAYIKKAIEEKVLSDTGREISL